MIQILKKKSIVLAAVAVVAFAVGPLTSMAAVHQVKNHMKCQCGPSCKVAACKTGHSDCKCGKQRKGATCVNSKEGKICIKKSIKVDN